MSAFQSAAFYELLGNAEGRLKREGDFLLEALARAPDKRVADIACGLGLHALFLAEHGAQVTATDLSEGMIQHARKTRPHPSITYEVRDMRDVSGGPYGLIFCLGNSLSLLQEETDIDRFFASAYAMLAPGGLLVTQTLNYDSPPLRRARIRVEQATVDDGDIAAVKRFWPENDATLLSITYFAARAASFMDATETVRLRHWRVDRLIDAANKAGLEQESLLGGLHQAPYTASSSDIVLLAGKPG